MSALFVFIGGLVIYSVGFIVCCWAFPRFDRDIHDANLAVEYARMWPIFAVAVPLFSFFDWLTNLPRNLAERAIKERLRPAPSSPKGSETT